MRAMAFNRFALQRCIMIVSVVFHTSHDHLYAQPKCYQTLMNAANKDWEHKSYQDAINKFRAALTCEEISAADDRRLREKITIIEEEYRKYLFGKIRKARKRADAYDLMFRAMEIKDKDPNMALSYLQAACDLSDDAIREINRQRMNMLKDPDVIAFSKYFSGFKARCIEFLPDGRFIAGGVDDSGNNYVSGNINDIDKAEVGETEYPTNQIIAMASCHSESMLVMADVKGKISICDAVSPFKAKDVFDLPGARCLALSPDGKTLAIGTVSNEVFFITIRKKKKKNISSVKVNASVTSLAFTPDGEAIYAAFGNEICKFTGNKFQGKVILAEHSMLISAMTVPASGESLFFSDITGYVYQINLNGLSVKIIGVGQLHNEAINSLDTYKNNNKQTIILSSAQKGAASMSNGQRIMTFDHEDAVLVVKHVPSMSSIVTASADGVIRLWEVGKQANFNQPEEVISAKASFFVTSQYGEAFVISNADSTQIVFSSGGQSISTFSFQTPLVSVAACPNMAVVADADNNIYTCPAGSGFATKIYHNSDRINDMSLSSDCHKLAIADDGQNLKILAAANGELLQPNSRLSDTITEVAFSPDAKMIMIGKNNQSFNYINANNINEMSVPFYTRRAYGGEVSHIEFSRDMKYALTLTDQILEVWDAFGFPVGDEFSIAETGGVRVRSASFSQDGKYILVVPYYEGNVITILSINNVHDLDAAVFEVRLDDGIYIKEARFINGDFNILAFTDENVIILKNYFLHATNTINRIPLDKKIEIGIASFEECVKSDVAKDLESAIDMYWALRANALDSELDSLIYEQIQIYKRFFQLEKPEKENSYHLVNYASALMSYAERLFNKPASSPADYLEYARRSVDVLRFTLELYAGKAKPQKDMLMVTESAMFKMSLVEEKDQSPDKAFVSPQSIELLLSDYYVNLSYYDIYAEKFDNAIIHADSSLYFERRIDAIDKECRGQAITNRVLGYLLKGGAANFEKAKNDYRNNYKKLCTDDPRFRDMKTAFLSDLDDLEIHFTRNRKFQIYMQRIDDARRFIRTLR
jgi:WD40 repeat protein